MIAYSKDLTWETVLRIAYHKYSISYELKEKCQILDKSVTLTKWDKVVIGVMGKIHSRQVSITVKNLLHASQFAESSKPQSMNELLSG